MKVECQCRAVSFDTLAPAPLTVYHCHCTECQRQSGSAYGTTAIFPNQGVFPLPPDLDAKLGRWTRPGRQGRSLDCYFCKTCGARIMHRVRNADGQMRPTINFKGGAVQGLDYTGAMHIYTGTAVVPIPPGVESYEGEQPRPVVQ